ncbi:Major Facilitator Superfamily protein [Paenibacillus tianmuensis]|uniref:Major Facilitator Superfamily protein n=1 Tax=Paenibacillus tianmuensis TaxID=624147 RepID=A0A1G4PXV6_9BACL|nr:MFS transporter [Paenibacillus tianmuensis]SCW36918.1 Major Facilitator Superfamily protein [Paenibacillus tianmuensis]
MNNTPGDVKQYPINFILLLSSRIFKVISDNFASIALVWLLIESGGGAVSTSILYVCSIVPQMALSLFISPLLNKGRLQYWMAASDVIRALIIIIVPICYYFDILPVWVFFVTALLQSVTAAIYNPSSVALLPRVVDEVKIQSANAHLQSVTQIVNLLGLACAGLLVSLLSASTTLLLTGVLLVISGLLILTVKTPNYTNDPKEQIIESSGRVVFNSYFKYVYEGIMNVKRHKLIFGLTIYAIFINVGTIPWMSLSAIYVADQLNGNATTLSIIRASSAIGALLMGIILVKIKIVRHGMFFLFAGVISGVVLTILGVMPELSVIIVCCFILGATETAINVPEMVILQTTVPQHQQAQVYATLMTISTFFIPIAILISAPLANMFGMGLIIAIGGGIIVLSGIIIRFTTPLLESTSMRT